MSDNFVSHLDELRRRIIISLSVFLIASIGCYFFSHTIVEFFISPLQRHNEARLIFQTPYEAFWIHLKVSALAGFLIASPVIFAQFWAFVAPGLYENEKKLVIPLMLISVLLFTLGAGFAYFVIIPWALYFFLGFQTESLQPFLGIAPYFSFLVHMILAFGVVFVLPVVVVGMVRLGVLRSESLKRMRKGILLIIFLGAAVLTPPDPVSQLALAVPLLLLFEGSVWLARRLEQKTRNPLNGSKKEL